MDDHGACSGDGSHSSNHLALHGYSRAPLHNVAFGAYRRTIGLPYGRSRQEPHRRRSERIAEIKARERKDFPRESASDSDTRFTYSETNRLTLFHHIIKREIYGLNEKPIEKVVQAHLSKVLPPIFREHELNLGKVNKVFAAAWVNDRQVVMGTKCNNIVIIDVYTNDLFHIPSLKGSGDSEPAECPCGIHAIAVNPSRTMIATGAENTNDLAVYQIPSFDPVFLGERGHSDWIFDTKWVDDEYVVTGSRDSKLAIWKVPDVSDIDDGYIGHKIEGPKKVKLCANAEKIRALAFNPNAMEMGVLSLNSKIHIWDVPTFQQKESKCVPQTRENVCMTFDTQRQIYAVGSQSHVSLIDSRTLKTCLNIESIQKGFGIRSVSFNDNIVTIGTGLGSILFYDLNAGKYLECHCGHACILKVGQGYLLHDRNWRDYFSDYEYANAIYTHCYDDSGTMLFTAGGPLPAGLIGNYAGVWQ